jgi:hypothetical protein
VQQIKNILKHGDPLPVAFFVFIGCIVFGGAVLLHGNNMTVIPIIEFLNTIISQDIVALISILIGGLGVFCLETKRMRAVVVLLKFVSFMFIFVASMFLQSEYYRQSTGIAYIIMSLASSWAIIRGIE